MKPITITTHEPVELTVTDEAVTIRPIAKARPRAPYLALVRPVIETDGIETAPLRSIG